MGGVRPFIDDIPEFQIRDGNVHMSIGETELAMPLRKFRLAMARAAKALATYDQRGEVVPMRRKRGEH